MRRLRLVRSDSAASSTVRDWRAASRPCVSPSTSSSGRGAHCDARRERRRHQHGDAIHATATDEPGVPGAMRAISFALGEEPVEMPAFAVVLEAEVWGGLKGVACSAPAKSPPPRHSRRIRPMADSMAMTLTAALTTQMPTASLTAQITPRTGRERRLCASEFRG